LAIELKKSLQQKKLGSNWGLKNKRFRKTAAGTLKKTLTGRSGQETKTSLNETEEFFFLKEHMSPRKCR